MTGSERKGGDAILGGLLVGGGSRRMGRDKALLPGPGGSPLAQQAAAALSSLVDELWLLGSGPVPEDLSTLPRLDDAPDVSGPLAGLLAALRHRPAATWVTCPCDLPHVDARAVRWLLDQRRPGRAAVLPRVGNGPPEPLFALYEPAALALIEELVAAERTAPRELAGMRGVAVVPVPGALGLCWRDADTPRQLERALAPGPEVAASDGEP